MVEFSFDLKQIFPQAIIRVQPHHLRPSAPGCKLSQILDQMGHLSAWAQGLRQPVTVAGKLSGDQMVYLITDKESGGRLAVTGLLKIGTKDLFLYDEKGVIQHRNRTPAILDFYVHETRQRRGQGKRLFDRMLADQGWRANQLSVDRPSHNMKAFLGKHYGLVRAIPQANNFVLYEGFFDDSGRVCDIFTGGGGGATQSRGSNQSQLMQQQQQQQQQQHHHHQDNNTRWPEPPGYKHTHGRGQRQNPGKLQDSGIFPASSSVADILGVGERINNRPGSRPSSSIKINQPSPSYH